MHYINAFPLALAINAFIWDLRCLLTLHGAASRITTLREARSVGARTVLPAVRGTLIYGVLALSEYIGILRVRNADDSPITRVRD